MEALDVRVCWSGEGGWVARVQWEDPRSGTIEHWMLSPATSDLELLCADLGAAIAAWSAWGRFGLDQNLEGWAWRYDRGPRLDRDAG